MAIPKATPTEYKGIVYRSKSEAMFARYLELVHEESYSISAFRTPGLNVGDYVFGAGFTYEPRYLAVHKWVPDFLRWEAFGGKNGLPVHTLEVIEYKPSQPTQTYVDKFADRCEILQKREGLRGATFSLYFGSVFNDYCGIYYWFPGDGISLEDSDEDGGDWLINFADAIRETRFDLEAQ